MKRRLMLWLLSLMLISSMIAPTEVSAAASSTVVPATISSEVQDGTALSEATNKLTVKNANKTAAKKLDKLLKKKKAVQLKVKASSKKKADQMMKTLVKKTQQVNTYDVIFEYSYAKKKGGYFCYNITADQSKMYTYSVKFMQKLTNIVKKALKQDSYVQDQLMYPDKEELDLRRIYEYLIAELSMREHFSTVDDNYISMETVLVGYDEKKTKIETYMKDYDYEQVQELVNKYILESEVIENGKVYCYVKDFETFKKETGIKKFKDIMYIHEYDYSREIAMLSNKVCDLSDAMKVYLVAVSGYFACNFERNGFWMIYDSSAPYNPPSGSKAMKNLLDNKAAGVCHTFACYEMVLFKQLGVKIYYNSSYKINHAWTVIKAKNKQGKTLWIPFDYGIGPSEYLAVSDSQRKYINTEKKRYKLYLDGIPGAPTYRNFTMEDFN